MDWFTTMFSTSAATPTDLWNALWITVSLLIISEMIALVLAVPIALSRLSSHRWLSVPAFVYSAFFRGTPLLVQIFLLYYGLAQFPEVRHSIIWPLIRDAYPCALVALSLNDAAYVGETLRAGIMAVPKGEREAALAVGMGRFLVLRRIVLPRAFRLMLPALCNEAIIQLKSTALASTITLLDITGIARRIYSKETNTEAFLVAGVVYVILTWGLARAFKMAELHFNRWRAHEAVG